jgi:flagellar biosynthesis/type III secretory pathway chaperone
MEMKKLAEELLIQSGYFKELASCLERETVELSNINLVVMDELNKEKEEIASRVESRTEPLKNAMMDVIRREGLDIETTLGGLCLVLKKKGNLEIPRLYGDLKLLADKNHQLLILNKEIAEKFAESVGSTIDVLTKVVNQSNLYGSSGGYQQRPTGSVLINREA